MIIGKFAGLVILLAHYEKNDFHFDNELYLHHRQNCEAEHDKEKQDLNKNIKFFIKFSSIVGTRSILFYVHIYVSISHLQL